MKRAFSYLLVLLILWPQIVYGDQAQVRIAIIDTGIAYQVMDAPSMIAGFNYMTQSEDTNDLLGHGTGVAGIIRGIAPEAKLIPLVIAQKTPEGKIKLADQDTLAQAVRDAIDLYNCQIINISAGALLNKESLQKAVAYAEERGVVVISSVGNDHEFFPDNVYYPAAYESVIGVSALDKNGQVAQFVQRNQSVSICAPGDRLKLMSIEKGKTAYGWGTSYATAYVSGAAAVILAQNPELSPAKVRQMIYESADDLGEVGYDTDSGWGDRKSVV